ANPAFLLLFESGSVLSHSGSPFLFCGVFFIKTSPTFGTAEARSSDSFDQEETTAFRSLAQSNGDDVPQALDSNIMTFDLIEDELADRGHDRLAGVRPFDD